MQLLSEGPLQFPCFIPIYQCLQCLPAWTWQKCDHILLLLAAVAVTIAVLCC
jgi:hypothetical protein